MPYTGSGYRLYYTAKSYTSGLTDVYYYVYKPSGVKLGPYLMTELNAGTAKGIYYDDFVDADMEGSYLFIANSISKPAQHEKSVYFEERVWQITDKNQVLSDLTFIKDIEGGKWELVSPNYLIMYKSDNITEVARWECFNAVGNPTIDNIAKCVRV